MFRSVLLGAAAALVVAGSASASVVISGAAPVTYSPLAGPVGTQLAQSEQTITGLSFKAVFRTAVYQQANGFLDFWYQVERVGAGTAAGVNGNREITKFNVQSFEGFDVTALRINGDPDGAGIFRDGFNPTPVGGSTTNVFRSPDGAFIETNFWGTGFNGLTGTERSVTYILRTNATSFSEGTFGLLAGGSGVEGLTFVPTAIPEPSVWAMMIGGFGLAGAALRRRKLVAA